MVALFWARIRIGGGKQAVDDGVVVLKARRGDGCTDCTLGTELTNI